MNRDEFMELVYETFADEPDNVLANGIIEAADAYVEHEKAQLSREGTTKGTTSDLISRQAARHALCKAVHKGEDVPCENQTASCLWTGTRVCDFVREIDALPPIQPEPKEGHWIRTDCGLDVECKCSACGYKDFVSPHDTYWFKRNYCPNCGAKMKGERQK